MNKGNSKIGNWISRKNGRMPEAKRWKDVQHATLARDGVRTSPQVITILKPASA